MSKASEFAKLAATRPSFKVNGEFAAIVNDDGNLQLHPLVDPCITSEDALRLSRWLYETFAEKRAMIE